MATARARRRPVQLKKAVGAYYMCRHCRVVDHDYRRVQPGHPCGTCAERGDGGRMYFEASVHTIAAMMEEASSQLSADAGTGSDSKIHSVAVVIFFCTAREALLNWFLEHLAWAQKIPKGAFDRLMADNNVHSKRRNALLPSLTGKKWEALVAQETKDSQLDYRTLDALLERAAKERNTFVHEGKSWHIDRQLAYECIERFPSLLSFYVGLHNRYVHPLHLARPSPPRQPERPTASLLGSRRASRGGARLRGPFSPVINEMK